MQMGYELLRNTGNRLILNVRAAQQTFYIHSGVQQSELSRDSIVLHYYAGYVRRIDLGMKAAHHKEILSLQSVYH